MQHPIKNMEAAIVANSVLRSDFFSRKRMASSTFLMVDEIRFPLLWLFSALCLFVLRSYFLLFYEYIYLFAYAMQFYFCIAFRQAQNQGSFIQ